MAKRGTKIPLEQTNQILYTCQECGQQWHDKLVLRARKKFCSRQCLGISTVRRLRTESPTSIEVATATALEIIGLPFEREYRIGKRMVVDFFVPGLNTVIECQGDFYHCNPTRYPNGPTHLIQRKTIERDARRLEAMIGQGYRVILLWESDIRKQGAEALLKDVLSA